ncbi:MAG: type B 50S ribosomal protein L31 [Puniceicoccales bacterium]|jgi:large subunit ribosomal protein L31|nr:type B 50S ribosomal protein L31 [Puniceicoccales bacterium]
MKKERHPELNPVCFIDVSNGKKFFTVSTAKARETMEEDGITYGVIYRDITSASHPAYTGIKRFVDADGRVEKFEKRFMRRRK